MSTASLLSGRNPNGVRMLRAARKHLKRAIVVQAHMLPPSEFRMRGLLGALALKLEAISRNSRTTGAYKHAAFEAARAALNGEAA